MDSEQSFHSGGGDLHDPAAGSSGADLYVHRKNGPFCAGSGTDACGRSLSRRDRHPKLFYYCESASAQDPDGGYHRRGPDLRRGYLSGAVFNPLATPDILGVSSGTCVGAILAILMSRSILETQLIALIFGLASVWITLRLARNKDSQSVVFLVLAGVIISSLFDAVGSLLKYTADPMNELRRLPIG